MAEQCLASSNINYVIIGSTEPQEPPVSDEAFEVRNGTLYAYRGPGGAVVIPEGMGITRIDSYAFDNRYNVTEITLPSTVEEVGYSPFSGAFGLRAIHVAEGNTAYKSIDGVLFDYPGTELLRYPPARQGAYTIPEGTISLSYNCFSGCTGLSALRLSGAVADRVFHSEFGGTNLGGISGCESLASIAITSQSEHYKTVNGLLLSRDGKILFFIPEGIAGSLSIPSGVAELYSGCVSWNCRIESIVIPASLTRGIDECNTKYLKAFNIAHDNLCYLSHNGVVYSKDGRTLIVCPTAYEGHHEILDGTIAIDNSAFEDCRNITGVAIPDTVTSIGGWAFVGCDHLTDIVIPASVRSMGRNIFEYSSADDFEVWYGGPVGVYAGSVAEAYCAAHRVDYYIVEEEIPESGIIILPRKLTTIEPEAFTGIGANYIEIPDTVTNIAVSAFKPGTRLNVDGPGFAT